MSDQETKHDGWNPFNFDDYEEYVYEAMKSDHIYMSWMEWEDKRYTYIAIEKAKQRVKNKD